MVPEHLTDDSPACELDVQAISVVPTSRTVQSCDRHVSIECGRARPDLFEATRLAVEVMLPGKADPWHTGPPSGSYALLVTFMLCSKNTKQAWLADQHSFWHVVDAVELCVAYHERVPKPIRYAPVSIVACETCKRCRHEHSGGHNPYPA